MNIEVEAGKEPKIFCYKESTSERCVVCGVNTKSARGWIATFKSCTKSMCLADGIRFFTKHHIQKPNQAIGPAFTDFRVPGVCKLCDLVGRRDFDWMSKKQARSQLVPKQNRKPRPRSKTLKEMLWARQRGICNNCKDFVSVWNMVVDHIVPKAHGGGEEIENNQGLCYGCNMLKGTHTMSELRKRFIDRYG